MFQKKPRVLFERVVGSEREEIALRARVWSCGVSFSFRRAGRITPMYKLCSGGACEEYCDLVNMLVNVFVIRVRLGDFKDNRRKGSSRIKEMYSVIPEHKLVTKGMQTPNSECSR